MFGAYGVDRRLPASSISVVRRLSWESRRSCSCAHAILHLLTHAFELFHHALPQRLADLGVLLFQRFELLHHSFPKRSERRILPLPDGLDLPSQGNLLRPQGTNLGAEVFDLSFTLFDLTSKISDFAFQQYLQSMHFFQLQLMHLLQLYTELGDRPGTGSIICKLLLKEGGEKSS